MDNIPKEHGIVLTLASQMNGVFYLEVSTRARNKLF
jgi:hypothetical protein